MCKGLWELERGDDALSREKRRCADHVVGACVGEIERGRETSTEREYACVRVRACVSVRARVCVCVCVWVYVCV